MSTLAVTVEKVTNVRKHPDADRLQLADVLGWTVVTQLDAVKEGDFVVYFPIDSVLPPELEARIFGADSKIKLSGGRVKTIRLRGAFSQGLAVPLKAAVEWPGLRHMPYAGCGTDLTGVLGVTKYMSPAAAKQANNTAPRAATEPPKRDIPRYTDLEHLARFPGSFVEGEQVAITEKLHGTSARYGYVRPTARTTWQRFKAFFGFKPKYQFIYGSRNIEYTNLDKAVITATEKAARERKGAEAVGAGTWMTANVYGGLAKRLRLHEPETLRLQKGEIVYGEIIGTGIQKGYAYGAPARTGFEKDFYVYDVQLVEEGRWLLHDELTVWCAMRGLNAVPTLYVGPYSQEIVAVLTSGPSKLDPAGTPVREGVVVRRNTAGNRMVRKVVSKEFLLRNDEAGGSEDDELPTAEAEAVPT